MDTTADFDDVSGTAGFEVVVRRVAAAVVVEMRGELDMASANEARDALVRAAEEDPDIVVADLSDVNLLDSTGLKVLLDAAERGADGGFALVCPGGMTPRGVLSISGAIESLPTFESRQEMSRRLG